MSGTIFLPFAEVKWTETRDLQYTNETYDISSQAETLTVTFTKRELICLLHEINTTDDEKGPK